MVPRTINRVPSLHPRHKSVATRRVSPVVVAYKQLSILAQASKILASSLDVHSILKTIPSFVIPALADCCLIDLLDSTGTVFRPVAQHRESGHHRELRHLLRSGHQGSGVGAPSTVRSGRPLIALDTSAWTARVEDTEHLALLRSLGIRSSISVPIAGRFRLLGAITIGRTERRPRYRPADVVVATDLGYRVALALDNARLFEEARQEVSRRIALEADMQRASERMQGILDSITDGFLALNRWGRIIYLNREVERLVAKQRDQLMGRRILKALPEVRAFLEVDAYRQALTARTPIDAEEWYRPLNRWLHIRGFPCPATHGLSIYVQDITDRKQAEILLRNHEQELVAANKQLEAFSSTISHDLRAPLRAIEGFSQLLFQRREALDEQGRHLLHAICLNTKSMSQLIDSLMAFARLSHQAMVKQLVNMQELAGRVVTELRLEDPARPVSVTLHELPPAYGDPVLLGQVWVNLLSNAFKFTRGRTPAAIEIHGSREGASTTYSVRDNGVGFDSSSAGRLFGIFQRLHSADQFEGTGVGLAIVERIIRGHGGRVWAETKEGNGATFCFSLPSGDGEGQLTGRAVEPARGPAMPAPR